MVFVGAEGKIAALISQEFPEITLLPLRGYRVRYTNRPAFFSMNMLMQLPKILRAIRYEKKWLEEIIHKYKIDAVISDNRYGLYTDKIPSVFITHQLHIQSGWSFADSLIQKINYRFINRFKICWIPDVKGENGLAGKLSHPKKLPEIPVRYIGHLSRFSKRNMNTLFKVAIIISGPEPQRTIFEEKILYQMMDFKESAILLRGLPDNKETVEHCHSKLLVHNHLDSDQLNTIINQSEYIIARSGYSTVMDLMNLKKKAILVPTPGQTEQEYIAEYLSKKQLALSVSQEKFNLNEFIKKADAFSYSSIQTGDDIKNIVNEWLGNIKTSEYTMPSSFETR